MVVICFFFYVLEGLINVPILFTSWVVVSNSLCKIFPAGLILIPFWVTGQRSLMVVCSHIGGQGLGMEMQTNQSVCLALSFPVSALALTVWYSCGMRLLLQQPPSMFVGSLDKDVFTALFVWIIVANIVLAGLSTVVFFRIGRQVRVGTMFVVNLPTLLASTIGEKRLLGGITLRTVCTEDSEDRCCICLIEFQEGEQVASLPCHHIFHSECIHKWVEMGGDRCPMRCLVNVPAVEFARDVNSSTVIPLGDPHNDSSDVAISHIDDSIRDSHRDTSGSASV